jgi:hypothetical protein
VQPGPAVHERALGEADRDAGHVAGVPVAVPVVDGAAVEGGGVLEPVAEVAGGPVVGRRLGRMLSASFPVR